jgi:hypothetical protein
MGDDDIVIVEFWIMVENVISKGFVRNVIGNDVIVMNRAIVVIMMSVYEHKFSDSIGVCGSCNCQYFSLRSKRRK